MARRPIRPVDHWRREREWLYRDRRPGHRFRRGAAANPSCCITPPAGGGWPTPRLPAHPKGMPWLAPLFRARSGSGTARASW